MHTAKAVHLTQNAETYIAFLARVSNPSNQTNTETSGKLIRYLIEHEHWSPFEMVSLCCEIETTRDISPQILRHRSFSFQEFSQRYAKVTEPLVPEMRLQANSNRQSSTDPAYVNYENLQEHVDQAYRAYEELLASGVARECARAILPACTPTKLYMHGTLRSWLHYTRLRTKEDTQLEHRMIAEDVKKILFEYFPVTAEAFFKY